MKTLAKPVRFLLTCAVIFGVTFLAEGVIAEGGNSKKMRVGFIGSLSSFAANYGTAVLEGVRLAAEELEKQGIHVDLTVEDDQSIMKNTVGAYVKLRSVDKIQGLIAGTWWAHGIVKSAERDNIPLLSCETLYNDDTILGRSYFILHGDLRAWVQVYDPLVKHKGWKKGAVIRYASGFGATLAREMKSLFTREGRQFLGELEYSDITMADAQDLVVKVKKLQPDVVYVDAQPGGLANLLKKFREAGMTDIGIITNMIADDVRRDNLTDLTPFANLYFTRRATYDLTFTKKFQAKYGREPHLNADLGYYSLLLMAQAADSPDPVSRIKDGPSVEGHHFTFDEHNVYLGVVQSVFRMDGGDVEAVDGVSR